MDLVNSIAINIYSILLLIIICFQSIKHAEKEFLQYKLYMLMLNVTMLLLIFDIFSRFDGNLGTFYPTINHFGNFMVFLLSPVLPSLWLLFVYDQVWDKNKKIMRMVYPLAAINVLNIIMVVISGFFGWFYYIDAANIYHRGPLFSFPVFITVILVTIAFILILKNRKNIEKNHYFSLLFFAVPPSIGIVLQIMYYGIPLMLNGVTLSLLIVFLNIQNHSMYTDYLTGINNRKKLDLYLKEKITANTEEKRFSAILIDLNNFKSINDTYGHDTGDKALKITAKLLSNCLGPNDFLARFGGDEFCIVLDINDTLMLERIVFRINRCFEKYNEFTKQPYKLSFSMGYAIYEHNSNMNLEEFQKQIDILMYKNKQNNKEI